MRTLAAAEAVNIGKGSVEKSIESEKTRFGPFLRLGPNRVVADMVETEDLVFADLSGFLENF